MRRQSAEKPCGKGVRQPKGTSAVILPMEANVTKAKLRRVEKPRIPGDAGRAGFSLAVSDPQPMTEVARFWRTAAQSATIGMFIILLVVALNLARPVLLPVASAFVVTMMLGPLSARAEQYKIPSLISAIALWLLVIAVCYGVIVLLAAPAVDWIGKAPEIGRNVQEKLHVLDRPLAALQETARCAAAVRQKGRPWRRHHEFCAACTSCGDTGDRSDVHIFRHTLFHVARPLTPSSRTWLRFSTSGKRGCAR